MDSLKVIENKLVPVYETDKGEKVVYGTELHAALEVRTKYTDWVSRRFGECDAVENKDFQTCFSNLGSENHGGQNKKEHIIKLDTAKEMAMLERNEIGKRVRKYFIEVEKKYKSADIDLEQLDPQTRLMNLLVQSISRQELEQKRQAEQIAKVEEKVNTMKEIFTTPIGDWKSEINSKIRTISIKSGIDYETIYTQMYGELENTAHCSLKRLQENKVERMKKAGNTKAAIKDGTTKIAIIHEKPQLKAIFENIVRRYAMSYCVEGGVSK